MADASRRRPHNVPGEVFVDDSCIDCGTCMWMQPEVFEERSGQSAVHHQPEGGPGLRRAAQAAVACPTASIGAPAQAVAAAARDFPVPVDRLDDVWHCGYHARSSFGAASYLVRTSAGNVLVDSPRFASPIVARLEAMGGVDWMVLTHRDDVADHDRFARHFGCRRVIHARDADAVPDAEETIAGDEPVEIAGLMAVPVPGHTAGSVCYLAQDVLFTGDHLAHGDDGLQAFRRACWYDWEEQTASMRRLVGLGVRHVLPGHGAPAHMSAVKMDMSLRRLIAWMGDN